MARSTSLVKARDLLHASVELDPTLAPAWAQLGRIHRLLAKYGHGGREENVRAARQAFETALALDPDSPQTHHLYTHFEIEELASPGQAMLRLLGRVAAQRAGAALYAGLATACRYCGLFEASLAAHARARALDPQIPTGVHYTYWMMGDYQTAMELDDEPVDFVRLYALPMLGRKEEALAGYADWRARLQDGLEVTVGESMIAALRGDREACLAAAQRLLDAGFRDAEGLYFLARCVAYAGERELALSTLETAVDSGFTCPTTMLRDPWLADLRNDPSFQALVDRATAGHRHAQELFLRAKGPSLLGLVDPPTQRM